MITTHKEYLDSLEHLDDLRIWGEHLAELDDPNVPDLLFIELNNAHIYKIKSELDVFINKYRLQ